MRDYRKREIGKDLLVMLAESHATERLVRLLGAYDLEVRTPKTPLDALQLLERETDRIAFVVLASTPEWALQLRPVLVDEFPGVERIALIV
ncbi:MAG: hypothetical protein QM831_36335 [Kofleriaceae bacterium]